MESYERGFLVRNLITITNEWQTQLSEPLLPSSPAKPAHSPSVSYTPRIREYTSDWRTVSDFTDGGNDSNQSRDECGPYRSRGPSHPAFMREAARLASFTNWPGRMRQRPAELVDAGFYYAGQGDQTICYHCGGGLKDWEDGDLPWEQHAMWFGLCPYLLAVKGEHYVYEVKQRLSSAAPLPKPESKPAPTVVTQMNDRSVDDSKLCGICCEGERNICIMPCGHVFTCGKCTISIDTCPVCRGPIKNFQRLYYS